MEINLQSVWPEWEIVEPIGRGGFGRVFKIIRRQEGDAAALKVISIPEDEDEIARQRLVCSDETLRRSYENRAKDVLKEIEIMKELWGTNNIVGLLDYKMVPKLENVGFDIYIRMELLKPMMRHLTECAVKADPKAYFVSEKEIIRIGCDICKALETCHGIVTETKKQIIHRDIKPDNILYNENGGIYKLGDFGISKEITDHNDNYTRNIGTMDYIAPEVIRQGKYDCRVDIYSLGMVLYYLANNKSLPFEREQIPPPKFVSDALAKVILKACAYNPNQRFATAEEFRLALEAAAAGQPAKKTVTTVQQQSGAVAPVPLGNTFGPKKRKKKRILVTLLVLLVLLGVGYFVARVFYSELRDLVSDLEETTTAPERTQEDTTSEVTEENITPESTSEYQDPQQSGSDLVQDGTSKETAIQLSVGCAIEMSIDDYVREPWEHWYQITTAEDSGSYYCRFSFGDFHAMSSKAVTVYDAQNQPVFQKESLSNEIVFSDVLPANSTYWVCVGSNWTEPYSIEFVHFSPDGGVDMEHAMPLELNVEYQKCIEADQVADWYQLVTGPEKQVYRFCIDSNISDDPIEGNLILALFDTNGIKLEQLSVRDTKDGYMDLILDSDTRYAIKLYTESSQASTGDYMVCVSQRSCPAGVDQQSAVPLLLNDRVTAVMDSTIPHWYVFSPSEWGEYTVTVHNIDVGCAVAFSSKEHYLGGSAENEDNTSDWFRLGAGKTAYIQITPQDGSANGRYAIIITPKE